MTTNKSCTIHYDGNEKYSKIKDLSAINEKRIRKEKTIRETFNDKNYHNTQCDTIPATINHEVHGVHMTSCCKKFTLIINQKKPQEASTLHSSKRFSSQTSTINYSGAWVYPEECNFCKLHTIKVNGKQQTPQVVVQMNAVNTIKAAAKIKDPDLYNEIVNLELFSKEFSYHTTCYNSFTYGYSSSMRNREKEATDDNCFQPNSKSDWEAVKRFISQQVLLEKKAVPMRFVDGLYEVNPSDTRYRNN